ncbi:MarR family transcriptional regulator [Pseudolabrys taiwanensis]|uniref:MarR family transcriptional regulator n=1 Tax=Pseudolabrys taiwanensis TaxID=331696 RepID=A0A345ZWE0_9HYPH|nr:MarR family transcriptional regulator [Pseudolabrys taiwanensis]AXK81237.1 MarR family transcriptional regulator [Pseudolabrys taiwanensis]
MLQKTTSRKSKAVRRSTPNNWHAKPLQERPGFLIRRLHQIHSALFAEECGAENITPVQYSILAALDQMNVAEQIVLSRAVGLDTTNVADVLARLERQKLVRRRVSAQDRRMKSVTLTEDGRVLLRRIDAGAARAHERTLAALPQKDRARFMRDLAKLVASNNEISRTPVGVR